MFRLGATVWTTWNCLSQVSIAGTVVALWGVTGMRDTQWANIIVLIVTITGFGSYLAYLFSSDLAQTNRKLTTCTSYLTIGNQARINCDVANVKIFLVYPCIWNDYRCSRQNMYRQKFWACNTSVSSVYGWKGLVTSYFRSDINWSLFWGCLQGRRFWWGLWAWPGLNLITLQLPKEGR